MKEKIKNLARSISYGVAPETISKIQRYRFLRTEALKLAPLSLPDLSFEERFRKIQKTPFFTQQIESEFVLALKKVAEITPKVIVEIGAFQGGTLALFTQVAPINCRFLSIDIAFGTPQKLAFRKFATRQQAVRCIRGNSSDIRVREKVKKWLGKSTIDVLFIDGDHSYQGVKADFENYSPMVRKGGLILFHDIVEDYSTRFGKPTPSYTGGVPKFWKELKRAGYSCEEFIENPDQDGFGIGLVKT